MYFDIGSNIGSWSLANINLCDKIISIEASPITFKRLLDNCKDDKIILLNYAVCNNNGNDITFYQANCDTLSTINKDWLTNDTSRFYNYSYTEIICKTITIDAIYPNEIPYDQLFVDLQELYLDYQESVYNDSDKGEYECIVSLTQKVKLICFEWASEVNDITFKCIDYLSNLGYTQFYIQNCDDYLFRPQDNDFYDISTIKINLSNTIPKQDWGMIWCK